MRLQLTIAFLLGVIATFLGVLVLSPKNDVAHAQSSSTAAGFVGVGGNAEPGGRNTLWLVKSEGGTPHLALYEWESGRLRMHASRNIKYDFQYDQYPAKKNAHMPSVQEVYDDTEKSKKGSRRGK